jgi:tetratricopeptide (TPR) repeat protein
VRAPRGEAEARAAQLAETASELARRGDYQQAMRLLDEAEGIAPNYVLIHQYRSNVAYLMGDYASAENALIKALEIEPDNALFRANLERVRQRAKENRK